MAKTPSYRLPGLTHRHTIFGRTGSGKTQYGAWMLSEAGFDRQPFVIVDYKRDELLNSCAYIREIGLNEVPKQAGLYIVHPSVNDSDGVEDWLWRVHGRGNVGLYVDEGYMVPDKGAMRAILTQGRSKHIPMTILTQRPVWVTRFAVSEADFYTVFTLNSGRDQKVIEDFLPRGALDDRLSKYHSRWYDVSEDVLLTVGPVPEADVIIERFYDRLEPKRREL